MNLLICLIGPSLLGMMFFEKINNKKLVLREYLMYFGFFIFVVNVIGTVASRILFNVETSMDFLLTSYPMLAVKYIFINTILAFIVAIIMSCILKNVEIKLEVKENKNEKVSKKNIKKK